MPSGVLVVAAPSRSRLGAIPFSMPLSLRYVRSTFQPSSNTFTHVALDRSLEAGVLADSDRHLVAAPPHPSH